MILLVLFVGSFAASQASVNSAQFPKTTELSSDLSGVSGVSNSLKSCITKVTSPIGKVISFADDVQAIDEKVKKIEGRIEVIVGVVEAAMLIPYVGEVAAFILEPAVTVLNIIKTGLGKIEGVVRKFAGIVRTFAAPLKTVQSKIHWVTGIIGKFTSVVDQINAKTVAAEGCVNSFPAGSVRNSGIHALEVVSSKLDVVPDGFNKVMGVVNSGCSKVEGFLHKIHVVRKRRGLPVLSTIRHVLDAIIHGFGPVGDLMDKLDKALHKKFCLVKSFEALGKEVVKVGEEVVDGAGHAWVEVEHVANTVGKGIENVGKDIGKGVVDVANKVANGVKTAGETVVKGVENVGKDIGKGVVDVANKVATGVKTAGETVVKGVENVGKDIGKGVQTAVHKVGNFFNKIFGRRDIEGVYSVDGKLFVLVDGSVDTRDRRGVDVCISVSDILKGINAITGGLMSKAQGLISGLFHGRSPFRIPGLTSDVLNIGSLFHNLDFGGFLPSLTDVLKLPQMDIEKIIKLDVLLFEKTLPKCAAVFSKIHI